MKIIITGATGMIGSLILEKCLKDDRINQVVSFVRKSSGVKHHKLKEIQLTDFEDYSGHVENFKNVEVAYFCLGAYTGQVSDELFKKITVDYAVEFSKVLHENSPDAKICLLSGAGADRSEKSRTSFARYKGMAENKISEMNLEFYSFRPAYIYPVESRSEPNLAYTVFRFLYPIVRLFGKRYSIRSTELAEAMFKVGLFGNEKKVLENHEILEIL